MTIPQLARVAKEKLTQLFGKPKADQIEREIGEQHPKNGVKRAEAMATKAGIEIPRPTGNYVPAPVKAETKSEAEANASAAEIADLKKKLADLQAVKALNENAVAMKALEICASQGNVPPVLFKTNPSPHAGNAKEFLWSTYHSLPINQRNAFYASNRSAMKD